MPQATYAHAGVWGNSGKWGIRYSSAGRSLPLCQVLHENVVIVGEEGRGGAVPQAAYAHAGVWGHSGQWASGIHQMAGRCGGHKLWEFKSEHACIQTQHYQLASPSSASSCPAQHDA